MVKEQKLVRKWRDAVAVEEWAAAGRKANDEAA